MLRSRSYIGKVVRPHRKRALLVIECRAAAENKIEFLLPVVGSAFALSVCIDSHLAEPDNTPQNAAFRIAFAKHRRVMASRRGEIDARLLQIGDVPMQPGRIDGSFLSEPGRGDEQKKYERKLLPTSADRLRHLRNGISQFDLPAKRKLSFSWLSFRFQGPKISFVRATLDDIKPRSQS